MSKHTKGQWVSHRIEETDEFAIFSLNTFIAQTENSMINEEPTKSEKQANANLIASSPEMLSALKHINEVCIKMNRGDYDETPEKINYVFSGIWKKAEKAINKAEGK